jgi:hypothetical protein
MGFQGNYDDLLMLGMEISSFPSESAILSSHFSPSSLLDSSASNALSSRGASFSIQMCRSKPGLIWSEEKDA